MTDDPSDVVPIDDPSDDVQFCSFCSESFPIDDPMVEYDGQTFCSPDCVREMLNSEDPCDHATYVTLVQNFAARLGRIMDAEPTSETADA